jgi:hypothetical protein
MLDLRRALSCWLITLAWAGVTLAQPAPVGSRAQVEAATANATASLKTDIAAVRITPAFTVGQYLDTMGAPEALDEIVADARQIGGPRWIDNQTCQVKLELPGAKVAYALVALAGTRARVTPIPAAVLEQQLADMKQRTFAATGTGVSNEKLAGIRPLDAGDRWSSVTDAARTQAVADARKDAARHTLDSIRNVPVGPNQTVNDLLARDDVQRGVTQWLDSRPVTELKFKDNLQVELTVSAPPEELFQAVLDTARKAPDVQLPNDEKSLDEVRREFAKRVSSIGRATVTNSGGAGTVQAFQFPDQIPTWAQQSLDAEGTAPGGSSRLKARTEAEDQASRNLRARIGALALTRTMTVEDAVKRDPRFELAVNRALLRARVTRSDWKQPNGSVLVAMSVDGWVVWTELRAAAGQ